MNQWDSSSWKETPKGKNSTNEEAKWKVCQAYSIDCNTYFIFRRKERDNDGSMARDRLAYISQIEDQLRQVKLEN